MQDKPTLCWKCAKACGGCSWSDGTFTPVDGWKATPTVIKANHGRGFMQDVESFIVKACPLFEDDTAKYAKTPKGGRPMLVKRPFPARTVRGSLRDKIWRMPDREQRIDRLNGDSKRIAELVFRFNNTLDDVCEQMFMGKKLAKKMLNTAMLQMEAME